MIVAGVVPCADGDVAPRWALTRRGLRRASAVAAFWATLAGSAAAQWAPDHPDVAPLLAKALSYLETAPDDRLGARCLVGLAFLKSGAPADHPLVMRAVEACREQLEAERSYSSYLYGKALAIILLTERNQSSDRELVRQYAELLRIHQKPHGGFGYTSEETGDTSQTQYAALAYWQMLHHGIAPNADSAQSCLTWLMRTQDVSGGWGYQGVDPGSFQRVKQEPGPSAPVSMAAAGMGSTLVLGNLVGLLKPNQGPTVMETGAEQAPLPPALQRVDQGGASARSLPAGGVDANRLRSCLADGRQWLNKYFEIEFPQWQYYYLYSVERYQSFEEYLGYGDPDARWFKQGLELLRNTQADDGSWNDSCGTTCATAFGALFLLRSTQQSIKASLGEGTLVGGRGLPRDLSKVRLSGGRLIVRHTATELDQLLDLMESGDSADYESLAAHPAALQVTEVTPAAARRLQQIVRSGGPEARLLAVRALGEARRLDYAPTLIFALTDPDRQVVRAARDALRSLSRNFAGYGPPDNFDRDQQDEAAVRWKQWYRSVRPDAEPLP